jgi:mRNA interferase RelE/StbE
LTTTWTVEFDDAAAKELRKLDRQAQKEILRYLRERIATDEDPRRFGKPLSRELAGMWRYRVRDYRLICSIEDDTVTVLVLRVGHRKDIYD